MELHACELADEKLFPPFIVLLRPLELDGVLLAGMTPCLTLGEAGWYRQLPISAIG